MTDGEWNAWLSARLRDGAIQLRTKAERHTYRREMLTRLLASARARVREYQAALAELEQD